MRKVFFVFFAAVIWAAFAGNAGGASVELFSPEGTVKDIRQVTARFTDQMVAFGDPRPADPFNVQCSEKGKGRWIDGKNWSYDFERALPAGVACTFSLKQSLKTLSGAPVAGRKVFSFNTGGPSVRESDPWEDGSEIEENQTFLFRLDAPATEASVMKNVTCSIEGIRERVGIRLITGEERKQLLSAMGASKKDEDAVLFQCRQAFPPKAHVKIIWGRGVMSKTGMATTKDQVLAYQARGPFTARFRCMKERPQGACIPLSPMRLAFSAPVSKKDAGKISIGTEKKSGKEMVWKAKVEREGDTDTTYVIFEGPFPEKSLLSIHMPEGLKDISGRPLANANKFPLTVKTDTYPALAKFPDRFGVIESKEGALLPVTVRNIEEEMKTWLARGDDETTQQKPREKKEAAGEPAVKGPTPGNGKTPAAAGIQGGVYKAGKDGDESIIQWLYRLKNSPRERSLLKGVQESEVFSIPKPGGTKEFEVIGIPLREPGFYVVEIESLMLGKRLLEKPGPVYVPTAALVTNMTAHFKWGRESSLVFVTALDSGEPVPNASVTIRDCKGGIVWQGTADGNGIARIGKRLADAGSLPQCGRGKQEKGFYYEDSRVLSGISGGLFVFARSGKDMTFTHSSWDDGIESWRFNLFGEYGDRRDTLIAHTVFDRTLLRAGETVHMKHFARQRTMAGLLVPPNLKQISQAVIIHVGSDEKYTLGLTWKNGGTAENTWKIPPAAKLGTYNVYLRKAPGAGKGEETGDISGSFRVEQFRVPLMRGFIRGPKDPAVNASSIDLDVDLRYLSGGGAADHPVKIRAEVEQKQVAFDDYEDFIFSMGSVKTGIEKFDETAERSGEEDGGDNEEGDEGSRHRDRTDRFGRSKVRLKTMELNLDKNGTARTTLRELPRTDVPRDIVSELEFRDPNGEVQTSSTRVPLYPSMVNVGIFSTGDYLSDNIRYQVAVLDLKGKPVPGAEVKVKVFKRSTYSHRRRITGGFYAFEHATETKEIGGHCAGKTAENGILYCEGKAPATGRIVIEAQTKDSAGNPSSTNREVTVYGKDDTWYEARNDDRIELIPVRRVVDPGETMSFEVRMPFRTATALVTVEREGVMDAYIKRVTRENPVIEIPVKSNYVPNVFVSALVVRGRLAGTQPTAVFDPGKPAYKLGITEIRVGWKPHALKVKVGTDKKAYAVRQPVKAHIEVRTPSGAAPPKGSEVALAVVDEGLLELKPNTSWGLLDGMMRRKNYEMSTATSQMMVVGKRHFGRKALPHGGGGGKQLTRELFDTLIYWKSAVELDGNGEADVTFNLNDSLTSFRVVAIASSGAELFGTGQETIRTTQDLMLLAGIPSTVREGDRFTAGFTVRNASAQEMNVTAVLKLADGSAGSSLEPVPLTIPAGQAREAAWQVAVPHGVTKIDYEISAQEASGSARDTLKVTQKVVPAVSLRVLQGTLTQVKDTLKMDVERPVDAQAGRGGVAVAMQAKLSEGLQGVIDYMRKYPYVCLEQKTSKAVALRDREMWKDVMTQLPAYLDGDGLAKYFPLMMRGSDTLTSYLLSISSEAGYEIPQNIRAKMLTGLKGFVEGKIVRYSSLQTADLSIRKMAAVAALARFNQAAPQLLTTIDVEPNLWPTSAVLDWIDVLRRTAGIANRDGKLKSAAQVLRSRLNLQGTTMGLSTERSDQLWWLMVSTDLNSARTLMASMEFDAWREDVPRIARGFAGRMKKGRWDTTTANAWGVLAMEKFSRKYETAQVTGISSAALGQKQETITWADDPKGGKVMLPWPGKKSALRINHQGKGSPWVSVQSLAAVPLKAPLSTGYSIKKTVTAVERKTPNGWTRGDVMRVKLEINARSDMTWVVVSDPIPSGSMILGSGLGQDSALLSKQGRQKGWAWEAYRERTVEALRIYYEFVPQGTWTVEYSVRLNNDGVFNMPETRVEALYAPEMFGEVPNRPVEIRK